MFAVLYETLANDRERRRNQLWRAAPDPDEHYVYAIAL